MHNVDTLVLQLWLVVAVIKHYFLTVSVEKSIYLIVENFLLVCPELALISDVPFAKFHLPNCN